MLRVHVFFALLRTCLCLCGKQHFINFIKNSIFMTSQFYDATDNTMECVSMYVCMIIISPWLLSHWIRLKGDGCLMTTESAKATASRVQRAHPTARTHARWEKLCLKVTSKGRTQHQSSLIHTAETSPMLLRLCITRAPQAYTWEGHNCQHWQYH